MTKFTNFRRLGSRSIRAHGLRRGKATARLLESQLQIPPATCVTVFCEYCMLSDRGLCDRPIPRPQKPYRVCVCVCVCVSLSVIKDTNNLYT